jgi:hypothetical protein
MILGCMGYARRIAVALVLTAPACEAIDDAGDCVKLRSQGACEDADPGGEAQCIWLDVAVVAPGEGSCDDTRGRCIGFSGTQQGCSSYACAQQSDENLNLYHRVVEDDAVEVLRSPVCGPEPSGDWEPCSTDSPEACACGCELSE